MTNTYRRFEVCEKCGGPVAARQAHPFPIVLQSIIGLNFLVLLIGWDRMNLPSWVMWVWTAVIAVLGMFLIRARRKASQKVLICIRCSTPVPS